MSTSLRFSGSTPLTGALAPDLRTHDSNLSPVIVNVSKSIGSSGDHFHLVMEALGDAVIFAEAPHGGDLLFP
jgi:hypothetical protein